MFCLRELKKLIEQIEYDVNVLCVVSEPEYVHAIELLGFNTLAYKNDTVGEKINAGIKYALDFYEWDYLMVMNSDSVIKKELFDFYKPYFESENLFFGVNKVTFVNWKTKEAKDFVYEFSILGVGKCIHRSVAEKLGGNLYEHQNRCLDDTLMDRLMKIGVGGTMVQYEGQLVYDIKSETNIHPWENFENRGKTVELCYSLR
jgi:hypothetical protein